MLSNKKNLFLKTFKIQMKIINNIKRNKNYYELQKNETKIFKNVKI